MDKVCKIHGLTPHVEDSQGYIRCKACRVDAVARRRKKVKHKAVEYKGGCCQRCGYNKYAEVLEFHHRDPCEKDFAISSKNHARSWNIVKAELDKCDLLCANCHREVHIELKIGD